jgi:hypothetical protein
MPLTQDPNSSTELNGDLIRICKNCGHTEKEKKGLVMETIVQGQSSESYKMFFNEFTLEDPRLPHLYNLACPNTTCPSQTGQATSDIVYVKYDIANMKYLYICTRCKTSWHSRS